MDRVLRRTWAKIETATGTASRVGGNPCNALRNLTLQLGKAENSNADCGRTQHAARNCGMGHAFGWEIPSLSAPVVKHIENARMLSRWHRACYT